MDADDPRHGSYAGAQQHRKDGEEMCPQCATAKGVYIKRMKYRLSKGQRSRVEIGQEAWEKIAHWNRRQLAEATGMRETSLNHLLVKGPEGRCLQQTRQRILNARPQFTAAGIQRRIRALARLGHSSAVIASEVGCSPDAIRKIRRSPTPPQFTRHEFGVKVCSAYDRLHMTLPTPSRSVTRAIAEAERNGWPAPFAWDDIDTDPHPRGSRDVWDEDSIDDAVIDRVLAGGKRPRKLTKAEAGEIVARSVARGMTGGQIEAMYGLKPERYWRGGERVA